MKKICIFLFVLCCAHSYGQQATTDRTAPLKMDANGQGVDMPHVANTAAVAHPVSGLLVHDDEQNCLALFSSRWHCAQDKPKSIGPMSLTVMTTEQINAIPAEDKELSKAIYDSDEKCLKVWNGQVWQCTKDLGGPWFSKDAYPIWAEVAADGTVITGSGGFSLEKRGRGIYLFKLEGEISEHHHLLSVTGNIFTQLEGYENSREWSAGYNPLDGLTITKNYDGFTVHTGDTNGQHADRSFIFIALVKGQRLPDVSKQLYAVGGKIGGNGSKIAGTGFSVNRITAGLYDITFDPGTTVHALTVTNNNNRDHTSRGIAVRAFNGFQYKTNNTAQVASDAQVSFIALVSYPAGAVPSTLDNRHLVGAKVDADGRKALHSSDGVAVTRLGVGEYKLSFGTKTPIGVTANLTPSWNGQDLRDGLRIYNIGDHDVIIKTQIKSVVTSEGVVQTKASDQPFVFTALVH